MVDDRALLLGVAAPEQEDDALAPGRELGDHAVGEPLPTLAGVGGGSARADREHAVEQEHAALGPRREIARAGHGQAEVGPELGEDVAQRRRWRDAGRNGERQPHRLPAAVVGILAEDHDAHAVERRQPQRVEDERPGRVEAAPGRDLGGEKRAQLAASQGVSSSSPTASSQLSSIWGFTASFPSQAGALDHTIAARARRHAPVLSRYALACKSERGPGGNRRFPHPFEEG